MSLWFRMYAEILDDPKVQKLSGDDFKAWVNLLALASRHEGRLPDFDTIAFALRIDNIAARSLADRLRIAGLIDTCKGGANGSHIAPHGWQKRQYKSDGSTERVKRFRNAKRNVSETGPDTDTDTDTERDDVDVARAREIDAAPWPGDAIDLTAEVCRAAGIRHCDPGHIRDRVPLIRQWIALGADPPMILAVVAELTAATTEPIRSLNFIDPHIRKAVIAKEQAANGHTSGHRPLRGGGPQQPVPQGSREHPVQRRAREILAEAAAEADDPEAQPRGDWPDDVALHHPRH